MDDERLINNTQERKALRGRNQSVGEGKNMFSSLVLAAMVQGIERSELSKSPSSLTEFFSSLFPHQTGCTAQLLFHV